jgi:hypothetical protein
MVDLFHSLLHEIFDPPGSMLGQSAEALGSLGLGFPELSLIFIVLAVCITLPPDGHFKIPHLWPGQNPPGDSRE